MASGKGKGVGGNDREMPHATKVPVSLVNKMKSGKGINIVIDDLRKTSMLFINFDGNETLELKSNTKDSIEVALEWIEMKYGNKTYPEYQLEIQDSKVVWKLSEKTSDTLNGLFIKELENIANMELNLLQETAQSKRLVLSCDFSNISEVRSGVNEILGKCKSVKLDSIKIQKKTKKANTFCQGISDDNCVCTYNEATKTIHLIGKDKDSITSMKKQWETFCRSESSNDQQVSKEDLKHEKTYANSIQEVAAVDAEINDKQEKTSVLKPTETEISTETHETTNAPRVQISKPRVQMDEPISNIDNNTIAKGGRRGQLEDSVGASAINTIGPTGETPVHSIYGKHNQQKSRSNGQQKSFTDDDIVGPERLEDNKYVFNVGLIKVLVYNQSVVDIKNMDGIVNAANDNLAHAGGIAYFISKAAGKDMDDECYKYIKKKGSLKVGDVYVSTSGRMDCQGIFHAVGPRWSEYIGIEDKCAEDLYKTIYKCLKCMEKKRWRNIALCAISSGIFGVPKPLCTAMYLKAIEDFAMQHPRSAIEVHFIDVAQEILDLMKRAHQDRLKHGYTPRFDFAFQFPSSQRGFQGQKYNQCGTRPDRDWYARTNVERHGQGGASSFKDAQLQPSRVDWEEYKPEKIQDSGIDIEKYCKLSKTSKEGIPQVEDTSEGKCDYHPKKGADKKFSCGHRFCKICVIQSKSECQKCKVEKKATTYVKEKKAETSVKKLNCPVCYDDHKHLATLPCSHEFCKGCLKRTAKEKPVCPICSIPFGIVTGTQPDGRMFVRTVQKPLPGYPSVGTIEIKYEFKDGKQEKCHPSPGKGYSGITRTAYLPDNDEGQKVLRLLKKAFSRRLVFTIGDSRTTGQTGQITWNDIHHKTTPYEGGGYGYPDETYLSRIQEELAAKGITE